jgi:hypothetical protein
MYLEYIYLVKLELKRKKEPFTASTFWISNKSYTDSELYPANPHVYCGLQELSGFSQKMGEVLPVASSGGITLNNNRGTLSSDKRWSDLLHCYAFYWQIVEVYLFTKPIDAQGDSSDLVLQFKGRINDTKVANNQNIFEIGVTSNELSRNKPHYVIDSTTNPDAPDGSLGVNLPVVFGEDVEVPAVLVNQDASSATYAYATNLSSSFVNGGVSNLLIKTDKNLYRDFVSAASISTPIAGYSPIPANINQIGWDADRKEIAFRLQPGGNVQAGQVIVGVDWFLRFITDAEYTGTVDVEASASIYSSDDGGLPDRIIASDSINLPTQTNKIELSPAIGSINYPYRFKFSFDELVIVPDTPLFISFSLNSYFIGLGGVTTISNFRPIVNDPSDIVGGFERFYLMEGNRNFARDIKTSSDPIECFEIFGAASSGSVSGLAANNKGFGASTVTIARRNQPAPDLRELEFVVKTDGLKDDSSGTITGSANQLITNPKDAIKLLYYKQNGDSLSGFNFLRSESSVNSAFGNSIIKGSTSSEVTYRSLIADILFCFASKLYPSNTGGYNLWSYGTDISEDYELSEADCVITDIVTLGKGSIINSVTINYDRRGIPLSNQETQRDRNLRNYRKSQLFEFGTDETGSIAFGSESLYTKEELNSISENIDWAFTDANARRLARYFLSTKTEELLILNIAVPALKNNFSNIKCGDIIRISHIDLPYDFGTAADGYEKLPSYLGDVNESFLFGEPWRRCRDLVFRVTNRAPSINFNQDEPMIQLVIEEISNKEAPRP